MVNKRRASINGLPGLVISIRSSNISTMGDALPQKNPGESGHLHKFSNGNNRIIWQFLSESPFDHFSTWCLFRNKTYQTLEPNCISFASDLFPLSLKMIYTLIYNDAYRLSRQSNCSTSFPMARVLIRNAINTSVRLAQFYHPLNGIPQDQLVLAYRVA